MTQQLLDALDCIGARRVLVVGDLALDEYLVGTAMRLSREAPLPVLEFAREFTAPGGAGNPAHNLVALGAHAIPIGVIGPDRGGERLLAKFRELRLDTGGIVTDPSRPTTTKTRIMAEGAMPTFPQQIARLDRIDRRPLDPPIERALAERIAHCAAHADALLISDYRSGLVTPAVIAACVAAARRPPDVSPLPAAQDASPVDTPARRLLLTVDSQGDLLRFHGFDLVRANRQETEATLGRELKTDDHFAAACSELLERLKARVVVITRAGDGLTVGVRDGPCVHVPSVNRSEVYDVTGAGDTVIAMLTLALACGVDAVLAAQLATYAAGIVVRHVGVAVTTLSELRTVITGGTR